MSMNSNYRANMAFEAEVRRVAEAVWRLQPGACQPSHYPNDPVVKEIDGIARLRDITHLLMATVSTRLDKIRDDTKKLIAAEKLEKPKATAVSKWIITEKQLDAQHVDYARSQNVTVITLEQFRRRFFDGRKYIALRTRSSFGSARNPSDNTVTIADNAYVNLPIETISDPTKQRKTPEKPFSIDRIKKEILLGEKLVLMAPFGSGKSLTTREVFLKLSEDYLNERSEMVPVVLNLREHWGQDFCDEMLERHARSIGYEPREDLIIAWRAGMICLLLDGFDEVASQSVVRKDDVHFMREARRTALKGVKDFMQKLPNGVGVFICGRDHYFDSNNELSFSLGLSGVEHKLLKLDEFTESGVKTFLERNGISGELPDWVPRKPLILSYLVQRNLFSEILMIDASRGFGFAWDQFLGKITEREAMLDSSVMEPVTLRNVLERLATTVRSKASGTGPITGSDLSETYNIETGQSAGEGVLAQLQRLPGLTQRDQDPGMRSFVDQDMLSALQGGALSRIILGQFSGYARLQPISEVSESAISMAAFMLQKHSAKPETVISVAERFCRQEGMSSQLIADCALIAIKMAEDAEYQTIEFRNLEIDGAAIRKLNIDDVSISGISFRNCTFGEVVLGANCSSSNVTISGCIISKLSGVAGEKGVPRSIIKEDCEVSEYDDMGTNNAVLQLDIDPRLKALLTILRKLYKQAGGGRKLQALKRGITQPDVLNNVDDVIKTLTEEGLISVFNQIAHPVRKQSSRVEDILNAPAISEDPVVVKLMRN